MASKKSTAKKGSKKEKVARPKQPSANGITRPREGGKTAIVWDIADAISTKTRKPAQRAEVLEAAEKKGVNAATAATQFGKWRTFNGLEGRTASTKPKAAAAKKGGKKAAKKSAKPKAAKKAAPASEEMTEQSDT